MNDGHADRMQHAGTWFGRRAFEGEPIAEHDTALGKDPGQHIVRGRLLPCSRASAGACAIVRAIGFGEDDIERDRGRAHVAQARDEPGDDIAAPRPLADRRQTPLVDVNDEDAIAGRLRDSRPHHGVVDRIVEAWEKPGAIHGENRRDEYWNDAA
jgi:hypothetical protein